MSAEALRPGGSPGDGGTRRGDAGTPAGSSHSFAVVLRGGHLIVAGTEEGGVLHQVPGTENPQDGCR